MLLKGEFNNRIAISPFLFPLKEMVYSALNGPMTATQRGLSLLLCAQGTQRCHVKILSYLADLAESQEFPVTSLKVIDIIGKVHS